MASVDAAFDAVARRHGFADRTRYFRLYPVEAASAGPQASASTPRAYHALDDFDVVVAEAGALVFWGDFFHMWQYQRAVANVLVRRGLVTDVDAGLQRVRDVLLLERSPAEVMDKAISFGGTLLFNTRQDERRPRYASALRRFMGGCRAVWLRDVYSALKAARLCARYDASHLCTDCAALLDLESRGLAGEGSTIGVFLGRSVGQIDLVVAFAADLARALGRRLVWQPWGDTMAFPALRVSAASADVRALPGFSGDAPLADEAPLEQLRRHCCIVTDTYHICVNAWSRGIPAICVNDDTPVGERSVNSGSPFSSRDKRFTFFAMYDALDFFVCAAELRDAAQREARLAHVCALLHDAECCQSITESILEHARASEQALIRALKPLLGVP